MKKSKKEKAVVRKIRAMWGAIDIVLSDIVSEYLSNQPNKEAALSMQLALLSQAVRVSVLMNKTMKFKWTKKTFSSTAADVFNDVAPKK